MNSVFITKGIKECLHNHPGFIYKILLGMCSLRKFVSWQLTVRLFICTETGSGWRSNNTGRKPRKMWIEKLVKAEKQGYLFFFL
jgi:hypothetical protein